MDTATWTGVEYVRPRRGWAGLISRSGALGPLPRGLPQVRFDPAEFAAARSYRWLAAILFTLVISAALTASMLIPDAGESPVSLISAGLFGDAAVPFALIAVIDVFIALIVVTCVRRRLTPYRMLCQAALYEELWFRAGAEGWPVRQRVTACLAFGVAHLANLVVAFVTLGMLAVVGGAFMAVYLRELRLGGDRRAAVVVAAKLHAAYNVLAFSLLAVVAVAANAALVWSVLPH